MAQEKKREKSKVARVSVAIVKAGCGRVTLMKINLVRYPAGYQHATQRLSAVRQDERQE
jgi:hypothetical protein